MDKTKQLVEKYKGKANEYDELKLLYEKEKRTNEEANRRISDLENQIATYEDWKEVTKVSQLKFLY